MTISLAFLASSPIRALWPNPQLRKSFPRIAGKPYCIPSSRRLPWICWRYTVVIFFAEQFGCPRQEQLKEARGDQFPIPEKAILNGHKQFMLRHNLVNIKATCSTENFHYGLKCKFKISCSRRSEERRRF
jgi:hypothetical protein